MAITLRQVTGTDQKGAATGTSTTPSVTLPASVAAGTLLVVGVSCSSARTMTAANGFAKLTLSAGGGTSASSALFWKQADGTEGTSLAPCTLDSSSAWNASGAEFTGIASPLVDVETNSTYANNSTHTSDAVNPTDGIEGLIIGLTVISATGKTFASQTVNGSSTSVVELTDSASSNAGAGCQTLYYKVESSIASGNYTVSATQNSGLNIGASAIAIFKIGIVTSTRTATPVTAAINELNKTRTVTPVTTAISTVNNARTGTTTAALSTSNITRTTTATAAILTDNTNTGSVTAAIQTPGVTRTAATTAALQTLGVQRSVTPVTGAILTNLTRTISPVSAAISAINITRTIPALASISGNDRLAPVEAAISTVNTRTTTATGTISELDKTRSLVATVSVATVNNTRTAPIIASIAVTTVRSAPVEAALSTPGLTKVIPSSFAARVTSSRTASAAAAILAQPIRSIEATASLAFTNTRTAPVLASIAVGTEILVPSTVALLQTGVLRIVSGNTAALSLKTVRSIPITADITRSILTPDGSTIETGESFVTADADPGLEE